MDCLLLHTLRGFGGPNLRASFFSPLKPSVDVADRSRAIGPKQIRSDLALCLLDAFALLKRVVRPRSKDGGIGLFHIRRDRLCLLDLPGCHAETAGGIRSPGALNSPRASVR